MAVTIRARRRLRRLATAAIIGLTAAAPAASARADTAAAAPAWPDTFEGRVEALAVVQTLNADILAGRSATLSLERWCADHRLAPEPRIVAHLVEGADKLATPEQRRRLEVGPDEPVRHRRVRLACGDRVLSEADNWYVPGRLTPQMNRLLDETDTPFGKAVQPLRPFRRTFAAETLWSPLPPGWEMGQPLPALSGGTLPIPDHLFEHHAVLYTEDGKRPFSEVDEVYRGDLLAFPPRPSTP